MSKVTKYYRFDGEKKKKKERYYRLWIGVTTKYRFGLGPIVFINFFETRNVFLGQMARRPNQFFSRAIHERLNDGFSTLTPLKFGSGR